MGGGEETKAMFTGDRVSSLPQSGRTQYLVLRCYTFIKELQSSLKMLSVTNSPLIKKTIFTKQLKYQATNCELS